VNERSERDSGFTLLEVVVASGLFVVVAFAGFEALRALGAAVVQLAARQTANAQLQRALGMLRSDALSASAIWKPASSCGDAVELLLRDAAGTSFRLYALRAGELVRSSAAGPLDPCDGSSAVDALVPGANAFTVTPIPASQLPSHVDPVAGTPDDGLLIAGGITPVAVDAHAVDAGGAPIATGNTLVEVTLDADPIVATVDLLAGNRPSAYTQVLAYACNGRCAAGVPFPEARNGDYATCTATLQFANAPAYYQPASVVAKDIGGGQLQLRVTAYEVTGAYLFTFTGADATTALRAWPPARWPPAGVVDDPYPVDYTANAVAAAGAAQVAADLGEPAAFAAELAACNALSADAYFHG
jgi:type II secretory pathway pseudopilin PulG